MPDCFVYIVANKPRATLYTGVTSDLVRRAYQHRQGLVEGFSRRYGLKMLVYYERFDTPRMAIQREKNIKHWSRQWKLELVESLNPQWRDLKPAHDRKKLRWARGSARIFCGAPGTPVFLTLPPAPLSARERSAAKRHVLHLRALLRDTRARLVRLRRARLAALHPPAPMPEGMSFGGLFAAVYRLRAALFVGRA